jgi:hypothetical protein
VEDCDLIVLLPIVSFWCELLDEFGGCPQPFRTSDISGAL